MAVILLLMLVGASLLVVPALLAQTEGQFDLTWWTVDGGGGTSADGPYSLTGTIGQPDSGALSDNRFNLRGGFWPGPSSATTQIETPTLTTTPTATITATPSPSPTETATATATDAATATGTSTIQPTVATSTATASTTAPATGTPEATPTTTTATAQIAEYHIYLPYAVRHP